MVRLYTDQAGRTVRDAEENIRNEARKWSYDIKLQLPNIKKREKTVLKLRNLDNIVNKEAQKMNHSVISDFRITQDCFIPLSTANTVISRRNISI